MAADNITWRTFDDPGDINRQWNFPATPTFYIIDHNGMIRHKWVGKPSEQSIDAALEELIRDASAKNSEPSISNQNEEGKH